jgi:hypothetical protein
MSEFLSIGGAVVEHLFPIIRQACTNIPMLFEDTPRFQQMLQDTWHMQWKKYMLGFLVSPWLHSRHQHFHLLPMNLQTLLKRVPKDAYWVFDSSMFLQSSHATLQDNYAIEMKSFDNAERNSNRIASSNAMTRSFYNRNTIISTTIPVTRTKVKTEEFKRQRVVLIISGTQQQIVCASIEMLNSSRTIYLEEGCDFFARYFKPMEITMDPHSLQIWALNCTLNRITELHMIFGVAFSIKIADVLYMAASTYIPILHPLRPLIEFVIFQMGALYDVAGKMNTNHAISDKDVMSTLMQKFEKRVMLDEMYWDVRQRVISRTPLAQLFQSSDLHPLHTMKHSLHADPSLQAKHPNAPANHVFNIMKDQLQNGLFSMYFAERCEIENVLMSEFQKLDLSTQHNIDLRKWSDYVQKELELMTNTKKSSSKDNSSNDWPYTVLCMLSDLIHMTSENHEALAQLQPSIWNGTESDNIMQAIQRIVSWSSSRQKKIPNHDNNNNNDVSKDSLDVGSKNSFVREFIMNHLVPRVNTARSNVAGASMMNNHHDFKVIPSFRM